MVATRLDPFFLSDIILFYLPVPEFLTDVNLFSRNSSQKKTNSEARGVVCEASPLTTVASILVMSLSSYRLPAGGGGD